MKTLITILFCGFLSFSSTASNTTIIDSEILIHQIWVKTDVSDVKVYYDFQEPSILDIIQVEHGKISWTTAFWELVHTNGRDVLLISRDMANDDSFNIVLKFSDLILSNTSGELVLKGMGKTDIFESINNADLIGKWKSPFYNKRNGKIANGRTPSTQMWKTGFEFKKDGTFQRHIQIGAYVEAETGVWSLSGDGQFVKLHFTLNGNSEETYKKEVLIIENYLGKRLKLSTDAMNNSSLNEFELLKL